MRVLRPETTLVMNGSTNSPAIAALFDDRERAETCVRELTSQGFSKPWLAFMKPADTSDGVAIERSSDGPSGQLGRFFSDDSSLHHALVDHGVAPADAHAVDAAVPAHGAVVVVAAQSRNDVVVATLERAGGRVFYTATAAASEATTPGQKGGGRADRIVTEREAGAATAAIDPGDYVPTDIAARAGLNRTTLGSSVPNVTGFPTSSPEPAYSPSEAAHFFTERHGVRTSGLIPNPGTLSRPETSGDIEKRDKETGNG